jgi:hypothetical protein
MANLENANPVDPPGEQEREELIKFVEVWQTVEPLLQDPTNEMFVTRLPFDLSKEFEALIASFPFGRVAPSGFRLWWELSEPKRRKWMEEVAEKSRRSASRQGYFVLANRPAKVLAPETPAFGSVFWVLASKDEKGRIRFSRFASGFLLDGAMVNAYRHSAASVANPGRKLAA